MSDAGAGQGGRSGTGAAADDPGRPDLPEAAKRALAEAEARRRTRRAPELPPERGGPAGPEPTRYGDWERKGIVSDF
ncbi:MAG: DUF1674 domain-containing protein [Alphaproteobacteria bacterium]|nr:MAG: DUF1674 domain-containing protein [Alphaproteobacteria bacterium]